MHSETLLGLRENDTSVKKKKWEKGRTGRKKEDSAPLPPPKKKKKERRKQQTLVSST